MTNNGRNRALAVFGLAIFILVPSFDTLAKYFGGIGVLLYWLFGLPAVFGAYYFVWPLVRGSISERTALILAGLTLLGLVLEASTGYPIANSGRFGGGGDVDDALIITVSALAKGNYPYYTTTYLGLAPSPMPGAILLALPWVMLGVIQFQNIFWLSILFLLLGKMMTSNVRALALVWAILLLSPTVHQSLVTGSDYISNTIYILVAACLVLMVVAGNGKSRWREIAAAAFFGLTLSSRSNFLMLLPLTFLTVALAGMWKAAFRTSMVALAVFAIVTIPFWAFDPGGFTPVATQAARLKWLDEVLPYSGRIIPLLATLIAIGLTFGRKGIDVGWYLLTIGIAQLFLIVVTAVVYSIGTNRLDLFMGNSGYGLFGLFFGAAGCWILLDRMDAGTEEQYNGA